MKTVLMSSAFALMIAPVALADQMAVVDFNQDGIISEADFIGSKSRLDDAAAYATMPQVKTVEVTRTVVVPGSTNTVPVAELAPTDGNYVNIGEYKGGTFGTLKATPATTRVVTEQRQVVVAPAVPDTVADVYPNPHGSLEASVNSGLINASIYQPAPGSDGVFTAAELGLVDEEYADDRLAAYDTNKDGVVTSSEAIANLDPLIDPNVNAFRGGFKTVNAAVTPDGKNLGE